MPDRRTPQLDSPETPQAVDGTTTPEGDSNPFLSLRPVFRLALVAYFLIYHVFTPSLELIIHGSTAPLAAELWFASVVRDTLLFLPVIVCPRGLGWLHPLIFALAFRLAKSLGKHPENLLTPLQILSGSPPDPMTHVALAGWTPEAVAGATLEARWIQCLALVAYYVGFFALPAPRLPRLRFPRPVRVQQVALGAVALSGLVFVAYMQMRGGIVAHMVSWRSGRFNALGGHGPIIVAIGIAQVALLYWYASDDRVGRRGLFWCAFATSLCMVFLTTGSRSKVFFGAASFLVVWMMQRRRVPMARIAVAAVIALVLIGALGALRRSTFQRTVDWSVLTDMNVAETLDHAWSEVDHRSRNDGYVAVVAKVPEDVDLLWGESYLAAIGFFVPRAIWPDKPRGASGLNGEFIFGNPSGGTAVPTGVEGEAYWNFHLPGVLIVFLVYGFFHLTIATFFRENSTSALVRTAYVYLLVTFVPEGTAFIATVHCLVPLFIFAVITRALPRRVGVGGTGLVVPARSGLVRDHTP